MVWGFKDYEASNPVCADYAFDGQTLSVYRNGRIKSVAANSAIAMYGCWELAAKIRAAGGGNRVIADVKAAELCQRDGGRSTGLLYPGPRGNTDVLKGGEYSLNRKKGRITLTVRYQAGFAPSPSSGGRALIIDFSEWKSGPCQPVFWKPRLRAWIRQADQAVRVEPPGSARVTMSRVSSTTWRYTVTSKKVTNRELNCVWVAVDQYQPVDDWWINNGALIGFPGTA